MATKQFKTNIPELIKKLGRNLYNDPFIAIRELLQNANDACILAEGLYGAQKGRIDIAVDEENRLLSVKDNGVGMTRDDLEKLLSTIASSKKKELREQLDKKNFNYAKGIAGQFGIGFLSTFIIADEVEVRTRHCREKTNGSIWRSSGNGEYTIDNCSEIRPKGTIVTLKIKEEFIQVLNAVKVGSILSHHCPFVRTPYYINSALLPVNHELPPWKAQNDYSVAETYVQNNFQTDPLINFYIDFDGPVIIKKSKHGGPEKRDVVVKRIRLEGCFTIPNKSMRYSSTRAKVYTSGLFVNDIKDGLPEWARFVVGGLECPDLDLTLGRDSIMDDVTWTALKQVLAEELEKKIVEALQNPGSALRSKWKAILRIHDESILNAAVDSYEYSDKSFFNAVKELIPFKIGGEKYSIKQIIDSKKHIEKEGKKVIFYNSVGSRNHESSGIQEKLVFDEVDMHFIEARNYYERDFLLHYSDSNDNVELLSVEEGLAHILKFDKSSEDARLIINIYNTLGIRAKYTKFKPTSLSAVILPKDYYKISMNDLDTDTDEGKDELMDILQAKFTGRIEKPYELCINGDNQLCIELVNYTKKYGIDNYIKQAFRQIYYQAVLIFGDTNKRVIAEMTPGLANLTIGFIKRSSEQEEELFRLRKLLEELELDRSKIESELSKNMPAIKEPNSVFLAYGYDEESLDKVVQFKEMLENQGIKVINGEVDRFGSLSQQIISRIRSSMLFVGILTSRDSLNDGDDTVPSTWVIEEKGVATAFDIPVLMIVEKSISKNYFGNIEGDSMRIEVKNSTVGSWLKAFNRAGEYISNTLEEL